MYDVAIIGAGVIGGMTARALARFALKVCLLEKENDVATGATKANSAIVHAGFDAKEGSLKAALNVKGSQMMPQVCRELGVKYQNNGSLVLGFDEDDRHTLNDLLARGRANGVAGLRLLEADELRQKEPLVSERAICALYAPTGAIVCPYELTVAAIGNAMDNGVTLKRNFAVRDIRETADGYRIASETDVVEARFVVNCAGVYADRVAAMIGDSSFAIHPRRGEYLLLDKACGKMATHTIFQTPSAMGKGVLVSPTVDGNLLLGPTSVDAADKTDKTTTPDGLADVLNTARKSVPTLPADQTITSFCGLRAVGSTGDFILTTPKKGFVNAAGIESPGLSASPAIAEYVVAILQEQGLATPENPDFHPIRPSMHAFREATIEEKNEWIRRDPAYGRIVCRCEGVTEGEIREAIRRHPRAADLDGVKRRTRAQMGRCQGGFCSPTVIELLAEEWNIPYEQVTKCGGSSVLVVGETKKG